MCRVSPHRADRRLALKATVETGVESIPRSSITASVRMLTRYKAWAKRSRFGTVLALPEREALRLPATRFGIPVRTVNHVYVADDIFRGHLEDRVHP